MHCIYIVISRRSSLGTYSRSRGLSMWHIYRKMNVFRLISGPNSIFHVQPRRSAIVLVTWIFKHCARVAFIGRWPQALYSQWVTTFLDCCVRCVQPYICSVLLLYFFTVEVSLIPYPGPQIGGQAYYNAVVSNFFILLCSHTIHMQFGHSLTTCSGSGHSLTTCSGSERP